MMNNDKNLLDEIDKWKTIAEMIQKQLSRECDKYGFTMPVDLDTWEEIYEEKHKEVK